MPTKSKAQRTRGAVSFVRQVALIVSPEDSLHLDGQSKICNRLYNDSLEAYNTLEIAFIQAKETGNEKRATEIAKSIYTEHGLRDLIPSFKEEHPFYERVHSSPLKNAAIRASQAMAAYRASKKGKRPGPEMGKPSFRSWKKKTWFSLHYEEKKGWKVKDGYLILSFGKNAEGKRLSVRLKMQDAPADLSRAKGVRIIKRSGHFCAVFTMEKEVPRSKPVKKAAYIEPNLKNFGYLVDTEGRAIEFALVEELKGMEKTCDALKRKRDRCLRKSYQVKFTRDDGSVHMHWEPSRNWKKFDRVLKRAERRMRELKKHHMYALAHWLCREYDLIGVGDYTPENKDHGRGRKANRKIRNRTYLSQFRSTICWVAKRSGKQGVVVPEAGTTRTCNPCREVVAGGIPPEIREWTCLVCGAHHLRDENASCNGLELLLKGKGIRNLQMPRSGHGAILHRSTWSFRPDGQWEMVQFWPGPWNEIGPPASTEAAARVKGPKQRRDSHRPKQRLSDHLSETI